MLKMNLKKEIIQLAEEILSNKESLDSRFLHQTLQKLYEKSLILNYIDSNHLDVSSKEEENAIILKFEKLAEKVIATNQDIPENNPHGDDIMTPGMATIKDMVSHMTQEDPEVISAVNEVLKTSETINESFKTEFKLNLNDRLALSKHLFLDNTEDLERVVSMINTIETEERALAFIANMVKPEYNHWQEKEVYEQRFLDLISEHYA